VIQAGLPVAGVGIKERKQPAALFEGLFYSIQFYWRNGGRRAGDDQQVAIRRNDVGAKQRQPLHLNGVLLQNSSELRISSAVGALDRVLAVPLQDASSERFGTGQGHQVRGDRKITRLNSSHGSISYAVFCLKKKITQKSVRATSGDRLAVCILLAEGRIL